MYKLELQWKEFNINLEVLDAKLRQDHASYSGNQAHNVLELWFTEEPSQEEKSNIQIYWDAITSESEEVTNYQSKEQIKAAKEVDKATKLVSAIAKLETLGLTAEEIQAILG